MVASFNEAAVACENIYFFMYIFEEISSYINEIRNFINTDIEIHS